jgi:Asp-tRNA(Asn)/Glu-tRNA(Gln) amidotransferase A subunit family amidase
LSQSLDHAGPIAGNIEDAAIVLDAITDDRQNYGAGLKNGISDLVVGIPRQYFYEDLDAEIATAIEKAIQYLAGMAKSVRQVECSIEGDRTVFHAESRAYHRDKIASSSALYDSETLRRLNTSDSVSEADYRQAVSNLQRTRQQSGEMFRDVDVLLTPTIPIVTPRISDLMADISKLRPAEMVLLRNTRPVNAWGLPAVSVPCGFSSEGLPIGLQIIGPPHGDKKVLRAAHAFERD